MRLTNLSLGQTTTTMSAGGQLASSIDLNPADGRTLSATITGDASGTTIAVSPKLDLRLFTDRAVTGDTTTRYDLTRVLLDGTNPTVTASTTSAQLVVIAGHLAIETNPSTYGLAVDAGSCFASTDVVDQATGELYQQWLAQVCQ